MTEPYHECTRPFGGLFARASYRHAPSCRTHPQVYLAADDQGCVVSHAWPGEDLPPRPGFAALAPPPTHYQLHSAVGGGISRMALVPSRGLLFTAK